MTVQIRDLGNGDFAVTSGGVSLLAGSSANAIRPGDLLLAALATCTAGTIRDFAVNNNVDGFDRVDVTAESVVATKPLRMTEIDLAIDFLGELGQDKVDYLTRVG